MKQGDEFTNRHVDKPIYFIRISMKQSDEFTGKTCRFIHIHYTNFDIKTCRLTNTHYPSKLVFILIHEYCVFA